jgi:hypothetical protein
MGAFYETGHNSGPGHGPLRKISIFDDHIHSPSLAFAETMFDSFQIVVDLVEVLLGVVEKNCLHVFVRFLWMRASMASRAGLAPVTPWR